MPCGDAPKRQVPLGIITEPWRQENARLLRAAVSAAIVDGLVGSGAYPDHEAPFTPEEAANICVDQCYLEAEDDDTNIEIEGYSGGTNATP